MPNTFYLDYENGDDANAGDSFAAGHPWKTITSGATAARIAPGDIIKIAKSPAPTALAGTTATWTNLSKTVTLNTAETATIDLCESVWTANGSGDTTVAIVAVATDAKEGSNCMRLTLDASPQTSVMQAYYNTATLDLSGYQKISFWIKNSAAILANQWYVGLCSDNAGATVVDQFLIPAIPSTGRWVPLTLTKVGGGNLGNAIESIAIWTDTSAPTASSNILIDDFIACTTSGLNLQSLISKNSAEQGGTEGWYGIQSINGTTVLLDNDTNTKANAGRGYSTTGTSPETVNTYIRETIKTAMAATSSVQVQAMQDSGTLSEGNIQFQGGYDTSSGNQTGETFFDGLNGYGYGIYLGSKSFNTINYLNPIKYNYGIYFSSSNNNTITTITNANNNTNGIYFSGSNNNTITTITNANNNGNGYYGIHFTNSSNNTITTITNANSNGYGIYFTNSSNNTITTITNANSNNNYGVTFINSSSNNKIYSLSTISNIFSGVFNDIGNNYLFNSIIQETTEFTGVNYEGGKLFSHDHDNTQYNHWIFTDGGTINMQSAVTQPGSGYAWKMAITSSNRASNYPLTLSLAKIACAANVAVTVKAYCKKDHATNVAAKLVCRGGQLDGVPNDVTDTKTDDTDWEELSISFTPTENGVIEIEGWGWYVSANSNIYWDTMNIT